MQTTGRPQDSQGFYEFHLVRFLWACGGYVGRSLALNLPETNHAPQQNFPEASNKLNMQINLRNNNTMENM